MMVEHNQSANNGVGYNNKYKFNGKELDDATGMYYYGARYYDPRISIFVSVDPLAEEFAGWTPYHYVHQNPINLIDPTGMSAEMVDGPGDEFKTLDDAAKDFGKEYNGKGIIRKVEVATTFYEAKNKDGESYYSYNEPKFGNAAFVGIPTNLEEGQTPVAIGHTHADILVSNAPDEKRVMREWSSDIRFSGHDIDLANNKLFNEKGENMNPYNKPLQSYLATPNGGLLHYDPNKTYKDVFVKGLGITPAYNKPIFEGLPSDPKSGGLRLNDIDPN